METTEDKDNSFKATLEEESTEPAAKSSTPAKGSASRIVDVTEEGKSVIITGVAKPAVTVSADTECGRSESAPPP